jgi:hypothetical protein
MMALSPFCIFAVRLLGWLPGDDTVFFNRGYRGDDDDDLFEFKTAEGNFNFHNVSLSHNNLFLYQL